MLYWTLQTLTKDTGLSGPTVGTSINSDNMCFVAVDLAVLPSFTSCFNAGVAQNIKKVSNYFLFLHSATNMIYWVEVHSLAHVGK